ncbi:MAG TPA: multiprotein bridging factor aMBF1 [Nitrososphaera sp.]|jgi:putative transcription factor|nr:multiprotein bridging factor aMBF1 [Nitrososphaera sp.]
MSYCELCGRPATEKKMVIVDGTVFNVCTACSKHGKPYVPAGVPARKKKMMIKQQKKIGLADETMLTPDFAGLIREARMKMGLTHEQLGMKMNEKAQLLKKFETGTLKPDELLAKKLERYLGIKLYISASDDE